MYTSTDIVNLQSDISTLKLQFSQFIELKKEITQTIIRIEYFLEHYTDYVNQDDLPLN